MLNTHIFNMQLYFILLCLLFSTCSYSQDTSNENEKIITGSEQLNEYLPFIESKNIGIVSNHTSLVNETHLVDTLLSHNIQIQKIFSPEHGFRGEVEAGELIDNQIDNISKLPVISLYGSHKKPAKTDLEGIDIIVFDMQDVGVRFYTYISTMHYVMEACAENGIPILVLDRPNPNGWYIDGPILDTNFRSFVGMHPVPLVHGMTIGEFAQMINGEGWLNNNVKCDLRVVTCKNYTHDSTYLLPVKPSPNLPNQTSIYLYPSLGFFEGTVVSIGRGTDFPFQVFGSPNFPQTEFFFTPESRLGMSANPPSLGERCNGLDLRDYTVDYFYNRKSINLDWLIYAYQLYPRKNEFFNSYFNLLAGNEILKRQIIEGQDSETIRETWKNDISEFKRVRKKYLLYTDFTDEQ